MTNFRDPAAIARDTKTMFKFWHTIDGLYVWEFLTTLSYEWSVIRRRRPYRWPIWIYSLTRVFALLAVIADVVIMDITTIRVVGCHTAFVTQFVFSYLSLAAASLLILLRILAIWNRNKVVVAIAAIIWLTNGAILIQGTVQFRAVWVSHREGCVILGLDGLKHIVVAAFVTDTVLLLIMFLGLLRMRLYRSDTLALGRLMWKQGVLWVLLAVIIEIPPTVFVCLNLNDPLTMMFLKPWMISMSIAATRMHRALTNFGSSDISYESTPNSGHGHPIPKHKVAPVASTLPPLAVAVNTTSEGYLVSQDHHGPSMSVSERAAADKPRVLILDHRLGNRH
ncbi:hypothetical protein BC826DRAFT_77709 [Russula brevipes]|nr:hypothetical protein BC826DRAFT_77709 [Russula brevipes]